ncbi:MAG TPA: GNAT family N-acetyltransferase [Burkholderiaceae bacterium]|nr:GNAT family N-acetyltransferase [Burkholderiaceae bacterium]
MDNDHVITLRPPVEADQPFLLDLYASTRADLAQLDSETTRQLIVRMQFEAQQSWYRAQYPQADVSLILAGDVPVGRLYVARSAEEIRLIDICLLPAFRRHGIGAALLRELQEEGAEAALPVRLLVAMDNPAIALYQRLGFMPVDLRGMHRAMEWQVAQQEAAAAVQRTTTSTS